MAKLLRKPALRAGLPDWLLTFADLMTLLLTFFVLLLSFSEMDVQKYRSMAESMGQAFGRSPVESYELVPIAQPEPTGSARDASVMPQPDMPVTSPQPAPDPEVEVVEVEVPSAALAEQAAFEQHEKLAIALIGATQDFLASDLFEVQYDAREVTMRFSEKATFSAGSATLQPGMRELLDQIKTVLSQCDGRVQVIGHSDDRPILQGQFRSNWDLSSARAVSVVHELILDGTLEATRVEAVGRAETQPLVPNDSADNRARNRRVEIHILDAICEELEGL